jgi:hypothetical protein
LVGWKKRSMIAKLGSGAKGRPPAVNLRDCLYVGGRSDAISVRL